MAVWKPLPTDVNELKELHSKLKDKEMRLEADLAIKDNPELEDVIVQLALATARAKKLKAGINKVPLDLSARSQAAGLAVRIRFLENQLSNAHERCNKVCGDAKTASKWVELSNHNYSEIAQLKTIYEASEKRLQGTGVDLDVLLPSTAKFIKDSDKK